MACAAFGKYYDDNMRALGLPTFNNAYATAFTILGEAKVIVDAVALRGGHLTVSQAIVGGADIARLNVVGAVLASFYAGASVGSVIVALSKSTGCSRTVEAAANLMRQHGIYGTYDIEITLRQNPQILNPIG